MRTLIVFVSIIIFPIEFFFFDVQAALGCTTFITTKVSEKEGVAVCKSFDYKSEDGAIYINKKGLSKKAVGMKSYPRMWESDHYSLTFNYFGREFPNSGMNDNGLVVEALILAGNFNKNPDDYWVPENYNGAKGNINGLQFVQYILDTSKDLDEAISNTHKVRILNRLDIRGDGMDTTPVHYAIYKGNEFIIVEYVNGKKRISPKLKWSGESVHYGKVEDNEAMPLVPVLANNTYLHDLKVLNKFTGFCEGANCQNQPIGWNNNVPVTPSEKRFRYAAVAAQRGPSTDANGKKQNAKSYCFESLGSVRDKNTVWHITHVPKTRTVYWRVIGSEGQTINEGSKDLDEIAHDNKVASSRADLTAKMMAMNNHKDYGMKKNEWAEYNDLFNSGKGPTAGKYNYLLLTKTLRKYDENLTKKQAEDRAWALTDSVNSSILYTLIYIP